MMYNVIHQRPYPPPQKKDILSCNWVTLSSAAVTEDKHVWFFFPYILTACHAGEEGGVLGSTSFFLPTPHHPPRLCFLDAFSLPSPPPALLSAHPHVPPAGLWQ